MLNTTAHANEWDYSYVTCGAFLPVILEQMARSWWNLFHKSWFSLLVFGTSNFPRPPQISFPAGLTKLVLFQPGVLYKLPEFSYLYLLPMLQSRMRVPRSASNYPRGSKWIDMGIWGRKTFVPGYHSFATVSHGWMNNIRKGMSTYEKSPGKLSISLIPNKWNNEKYTESFGVQL